MANTFKQINITSPSSGGGGTTTQLEQVFLQSQGGTVVSGLIFDSLAISGFKTDIIVDIDATADIKEYFTITGVFDNNVWDIQIESVGGNSFTTFTINSVSGQISYSSSTYSGFTSGKLSYKTETLTTSI